MAQNLTDSFVSDLTSIEIHRQYFDLERLTEEMFEYVFRILTVSEGQTQVFYLSIAQGRIVLGKVAIENRDVREPVGTQDKSVFILLEDDGV